MTFRLPPSGPRGDVLRVEDLEGGIRVLTLDRPDRKNAIDEGLLDRLAAALDPQGSSHVRALLFRGAGGAFSSGSDLVTLPHLEEGGPLPDDRVQEVLARVPAHPAPSVALVEGPAFGAGCDLASACDFRIAAPTAVFCMPPARLGIVYAEEGLSRLAGVVGLQRARTMFLTGRRVDATTAQAWGLVDELAENVEDAEARALALCRQLAENAPLAVQGMRQAMGLIGRVALSDEERLHLRALRAEAFGSDDAREGRAAFQQKRPPRFTGR